MYRTIVARLPDYALQRRAIPHIGASMAAPPGVGSQKKTPAALKRERGPPHRAATSDAAPDRAHHAGCCAAAALPRTSHWIHLAYSASLKPAPGTQKQKIGSNCNFFAIADCRGAPNRDRGPKTRQIDLFGDSFPPCGDARASAIAKKLQKKADFCFCGVNCRNRSRFP